MTGALESAASRVALSPQQQMLEALSRIEARLDRLERAVARDAPDALAMVTDTADGWIARAAERGIDVDARARAALALVEQITEPRTLAALGQAAELAKTLPDLVAMAADTADGAVGALAARGIDVDARAHDLARVAERLTSKEALDLLCTVLDRVDAVQTVLDSGVLDPGPTAMVARAGRAVAEAAASEPAEVGTFGLLRALSDPDVRRATGLLVDVARRLGRSLDETKTDRRLSKGGGQ